MKKTLLALVLTYMVVQIYAIDSVPEPPKPKPVEIKWSGFLMNQLFYDTRRNVEALDGMVILFPMPKSDTVGDDLNAIHGLNLLSFASRLRTNITGPDAFGASTSGYFEFDFTARANCATVRFRQAWIKMSWKKTDLLVGRTWHPMCSMDVIPSVMALSIGAPFQPFNRSDQITLTQKAGKFNFILSAIFQNDYTNNGPSKKTPAYQTYTGIPNVDIQAKYKSDNLIVGAGFDFKRLQPRFYTNYPKDTTKKFTTDATVNCPAFLFFAQYKIGKLSVGAKTILADNLSESLMTGAFGISEYDTSNGHEKYTPYRHWFLWGNVSYGNKLKVGVFGGYLKNLGATENLITPLSKQQTVVFGLGDKIGYMYRVVPQISYTSGKMILAFEVEYSLAAYGIYDYADKGKIIKTSNISSTRLLATMMYNF